MKNSLKFSCAFVFISIIYQTTSFAQFTPPGLGRIHTATWYALGLKQNLNKKNTVVSTTYFGVGTTSNPSNYNPFERMGIYVINEEVSHHFATHWQYSGAASYRWQDMYKPFSPYEAASPSGRQEIRFYSRFTYLKSYKKIDLSFTYRPELRFFYNPDFSKYHESIEFRSRFSGKMAYNFDSPHDKKIMLTTELLFATSKEENWSKWKYKEARISVYYSFNLPSDAVVLSLGYMNDIIGIGKNFDIDASYLAFDIAFKEPFKHHSSPRI